MKISKSVLHVEVLRFGLSWRSRVRLFVYLSKKTVVEDGANTLLCNSVKVNQKNSLLFALPVAVREKRFLFLALRTNTDNVCVTGGSVQ